MSDLPSASDPPEDTGGQCSPEDPDFPQSVNQAEPNASSDPNQGTSAQPASASTPGADSPPLTEGANPSTLSSPAPAPMPVQFVEEEMYSTCDNGQYCAELDLGIQAHAYIAGETRLFVTENWPLADYYVFIDSDPTEKIDFDHFGMLWTDERGYLHLTDGDGNPTERLSDFPIAWSSDQASSSDGAVSCLLIYDEDPGRLKQKKAKVEASAKQCTDSNRFRFRADALRSLGGSEDHAFQITVPPDPDVLDLATLQGLISECDEAFADAEKGRDELLAFFNKNTENQVMAFNREEVNDWIDAKGQYAPSDADVTEIIRLERRSGLTRLSPEVVHWDVACKNFDRDLAIQLNAYEKKLDPLYGILTDDHHLDDIGKVGVVLEGLENVAGEHLLWRHQFILKSCGLFASTKRSADIAAKLVVPLCKGLSQPWSEKRKGCRCPTCGPMKPGFGNPDKKLADNLQYVAWKSKDLKLITSAGSRTLDMMTKFIPSLGEAYVSATVQKLGVVDYIGYPMLVRLQLVYLDATTKGATGDWGKLLEQLKEIESAKSDTVDLRSFKSKVDSFLKSRTKNLVDADRFGGFINALAGVIVLMALARQEKSWRSKDYVDFIRAIADVAKGAHGMSKGALEAALATRFAKTMAGDAAKNSAKQVMAVLGQGMKWVSFVGGALQLASASISLSDAADRGDSREFWYSFVQVVGADVAAGGLALDLMPEPLVTKGSGVILNFIGGVIYLTGQIGEFVSRPDAPEKFLRGFWYYDSNDHSTPQEKQQLEEAERVYYAKKRQERFERDVWKR